MAKQSSYKNKMILLETKRLLLRELKQNDFNALLSFLNDPQTMYAYEHGFSKKEVQALLEKQIHSYAVNNFGLWAAILKETETCIGLCGITLQAYKEKQVPELGYIFQKGYWHQGYAAESALACKEYAFENLELPQLYAIIRDSNLPSQKLAERLGMHKIDTIIKHYYGFSMPHYVYTLKNYK